MADEVLDNQDLVLHKKEKEKLHFNTNNCRESYVISSMMFHQ